MKNINLINRFRRQLGDAIACWNSGEEEKMVGIIQEVQAEAFADGCRYMREQVEEVLNTEREAGYYEK